MTSVGIEEVVKSARYTVKILQEIFSDSLEFNTFERAIMDMTDKRNKFEEENKLLLQTLSRKVSNSVNCGCIRKYIEESFTCVTQSWMKNEYDVSVIEWFPLKNANIMVIIKVNEGVDDEGISRKLLPKTAHIGSSIFSHSKRLMNDVILALDGFENIKNYYGDTDSIYIHNDAFEILKTKGLIGKNLCQSKNDYGKGGCLKDRF